MKSRGSADQMIYAVVRMSLCRSVDRLWGRAIITGWRVCSSYYYSGCDGGTTGSDAGRLWAGGDAARHNLKA